ncbi:hypothetical protein M422DRAFT_71903 [Sphaerobolus stellatus SS14]|uniref:C2H2-type domain-containing protein n=1 Tax=Sphaerobolus stellatus (strain SS14) TaxID=990650 RepID=A0A0C9UM08_SPHS4|nr:hypothetical protein M422DRAFT_71903 [Sphaerobolus stellatus SS14]
MPCELQNPFNLLQVSSNHPRLVPLENDKYGCTTCGQTFQGIRQANDHAVGQFGIFVCYACRYGFTSESSLNSHTTLGLCNYQFVSTFNLSQPKLPRGLGHVLLPKNSPQGYISGEIPSDRKGYRCICGARFTEPNAAHNGKLHVMHECYIYACPVCGERCKRQKEAKQHCTDGPSRRRRATQARTSNDHFRGAYR